MTTPRTTRPLLALLAVLLLGTACGGASSGVALIQEDTAAVVQAMNAKDYAAARRALATLDADIAAAGRLKQLEADTVTRLRAGVATLRADLAQVSPLPTPTPARTTTRPPVVRDDKDEDKDDEDKGDDDKGGGKKGRDGD